MSDDVPAVAEVVYTAFGEIVYQDASVGTRYRYAGEYGYECFDDMDWGEFGGVDFEFPYLHLGHRWYDPTTGRFLQRDPTGIRRDGNVYVYAANNPVWTVDPNGLDGKAKQSGKGENPFYHMSEEELNKAYNKADKSTKEGRALRQRIKEAQEHRGFKKSGKATNKSSRLKKLKKVAKKLAKKTAKGVAGKAFPPLGVCFFLHGWYNDGFESAFNDATWPASEAWD